jgi:hypothetical protein
LKKIPAIFLLAIHLFNLGGYRLLFDMMEHQVGEGLVESIDHEQYDEHKLIEIRVPLNLQYHANWEDFERFDGEITISGVHYNYVKRKLHNDTLILLAIPNEVKTRLYNAKETFISLVNDMQQGEQASHGSSVPVKPVKIFQFECCVDPFHDGECCDEHLRLPYGTETADSLLTVFTDDPAQPPELKA